MSLMSMALNIEGTQVIETATLTRRERRAVRQRRFVTTRKARLARLDYKTCNESDALKVPSKVRMWHLGTPDERAGSTYVVGISNVKLANPIIHHRWRRLLAKQATDNTNE